MYRKPEAQITITCFEEDVLFELDREYDSGTPITLRLSSHPRYTDIGYLQIIRGEDVAAVIVNINELKQAILALNQFDETFDETATEPEGDEK